MGNSLSPIVADLVMESIIDSAMEKLNKQLPVLKKYVDDLILSIPEDQITDTLQTFNDIDPHIQFTCEIETNGRLPFLDFVLVRLPDQSIKTEWYAKPMASGRFLDFHSYHPMHMKMNVVKNFIDRVREHSTNLSSMDINSIIEDHLKRNHYPRSLRHRMINTASQRIVTSPPSTQSQQTVIYKPMLYVPRLTEKIKKSMRKDFPTVSLATRNDYSVDRIFTNTKDRIDPTMKHSVIYRIPCNDCEKSYIGLTTTHLKKRVSNHRSDINKSKIYTTNNPTSSHDLDHLCQKTALIEHAIKHHHEFNLNDVKVLDQHRRSSALPILEICHILSSQGSVNKRSDVDGLSSTYAGLLHSLKNRRTVRTSTTNTNTNQSTPIDDT